MFDLKACRPIAASSRLPFGHVTDRSGWLLLRWRLSSCEMIFFFFFSFHALFIPAVRRSCSASEGLRLSFPVGPGGTRVGWDSGVGGKVGAVEGPADYLSIEGSPVRLQSQCHCSPHVVEKPF